MPWTELKARRYNMCPVLAIDVYEHAYVSDFGATPDGRKQYVEALFKNLDWDHVNRQLAQAEAARAGAQSVGAEDQVSVAQRAPCERPVLPRRALALWPGRILGRAWRTGSDTRRPRSSATATA